MPRWRMHMWIVLLCVSLMWWALAPPAMNGVITVSETSKLASVSYWVFFVELLGSALWAWVDRRFMRAQRVARLLKANGNSPSF